MFAVGLEGGTLVASTRDEVGAVRAGARLSACRLGTAVARRTVPATVRRGGGICRAIGHTIAGGGLATRAVASPVTPRSLVAAGLLL